MSFEFFIAKKYFRAKRRTGFISIISYVSIMGVTIGVTALILVLSVMNGFEEEVRSKLIGADAHLRLRKFYTETITNYEDLLEKVRSHPHVVGASPTIFEEGMVRSKNAQKPTGIKAVDVNSISSISEIAEYTKLGEFTFERKMINGKEYPGIVLGRYIAENLLAFDQDDIVTLMTLPQDGGIFSQPRVMQFYVAGIVELGYFEYDRFFSYISLQDAQKLFEMPGGVSWIEVKLDDYEKAGEVAQELVEKIGGYPFTSLTWFELNKSLFSWMKIEKWGAFIILCLIIMVAAFNIISSLIMIVMEKTREIGILKSMGATSKSIKKIFLLQGISVGMIGTVLGSFLGYGIGFLQLKYKLISLPADVYIISSMPIKLQLFDFLAISSAAIILCLLASIYPAHKASKLFPVDAIRYE